MNKFLSRIGTVAAVLLLTTLGFAAGAHADDTEIFFTNSTVTVPANILLILDTSGSMATQISQTQVPYDPTHDYTADYNTCSSAYVFFAAPTGNPATVTPPSCSSTTSRMTVAQNKCSASATALSTGVGGTGIYIDSFIRWGSTATNVTTTVINAPTTQTLCTNAGGTWRNGTCRLNTQACTNLGGNQYQSGVCSIVVTSSSYSWQSNLAAANGTDVECYGDRPGTGTDTTYPNKNASATNTTANEYSSVAGNSWWTANGSGGSYTLYSANYLDWYYNPQYQTATRLSTVQSAVAGPTGMLSTLTNANVGLMRYSYNAQGGMVVDPVQSLNTMVNSTTTQRTQLQNDVNSFTANGYTPLTETLFEAYRYYSAGSVGYGLTSTVPGTFGLGVSFPSVAASRSGNTYISPITTSCSKNYIVYLTDGLPTQDSDADTAIRALPSFSSNAGSCYGSATAMATALGTTLPAYLRGGGDGTGLCLEAMAQYLNKTDLRSGTNFDGVQNVVSYFIGFGSDFQNGGAGAAAFQLLTNAGQRGGGGAYSATDLNSLTTVLNSIQNAIAQNTNTLFSAPTVAVNAFNRTQTLDDLYVSVFEPESTYRWPGNLKKYKVTNEQVVDALGNPAVNSSTGFFATGAQSYWSTSPDGPTVTLGGAAHRLPDPSDRSLYTYIGSNTPSSPQSLTLLQTAITSTNASTELNLTTGDPTYTNLVAWAQGVDVLGQNPASDPSGVRHAMGDPVHSEPAALIYSKGTSGVTGFETVVFVTTNDGYLHAINATAAADGTDITSATVGQSSGEELWSFIPQELLPDLKNLYANAGTTTKHYGLDGPVRLLKYDVNGDGVIDPAAGDRVLLYFSTGRNTNQSRYYALDVTDKNNPQFLWSLQPGNPSTAGNLPGLGQTWSPPTIARVKVGNGSSQNAQQLVLIFGGGYSSEEDNTSYVPGGDAAGNHIYMVDAKTGALLWAAGPSAATGINLVVPRMTHAIPSSITVLDTNNDGYADRMYVGDMAGQVWRFDITNGAAVTSLVAGNVMASLGTKESITTHPASDTRRFYAEPDVALVEPVGSSTSFFNIAIGSGYRGHPLDASANDRLYSIRDYNPFTVLTQTQYNTNAVTPILDSNLVDITTNVAPNLATIGYGWKLLLDTTAGTWVGEKVLTSARTLDNVVYFVSYTPGAVTTTDICSPSRASGANRIYAVSAFSGAPVKDYSNDGNTTVGDRSKALAQGGIAPGVSLLFPSDKAKDVLVMSGPETVGICSDCRGLAKTYWHDNATD